MSEAAKGNTVKVHYTGKLEDDTVFDSSRDREPLEFEVGAGQMIPGFDKAVLGMKPGEKKSIHIPSDEAYGPKRDDMMVTIKKEEFPENVNPKVGQQLQVKRENGHIFNVVVADIDGSNVTLDANHPLAGKDLYFDIELVDIA
jgi:FKBP-type peptidyl-prolyl cis-trans isomerase 2